MINKMLNLVRDEAAPSPLPPSPAPAALATQVQGPARPGYSAPPPRNVGLQTPTISWASHLPGGEG